MVRMNFRMCNIYLTFVKKRRKSIEQIAQKYYTRTGQTHILYAKGNWTTSVLRVKFFDSMIVHVHVQVHMWCRYIISNIFIYQMTLVRIFIRHRLRNIVHTTQRSQDLKHTDKHTEETLNCAPIAQFCRVNCDVEPYTNKRITQGGSKHFIFSQLF